MMSSFRFTQLVLLTAALYAVAAIGAGRAAAADIPPHGAPAVVACEMHADGNGLVHTFFTSPMPNMESRPETLGMITGNGTSTPSYDEWLYYQIKVVWYENGSWHSRSGILDADRNAHSAGAPSWMLIDGTWQFPTGGWSDGATPGNSTVEAPYSQGIYWIYASYWWGPFASYGWLQYGQWLGPYTCIPR